MNRNFLVLFLLMALIIPDDGALLRPFGLTPGTPLLANGQSRDSGRSPAAPERKTPAGVQTDTLMGPKFREFFDRVNSSPQEGRQAIVDSFMIAVSANWLPFVEDTIAHFLYRGSTANSVSVAGDMNGWNGTASNMMRVSTTNLWFLGLPFERDARLDYKIVVNNSTWILDPGNPRTCPGGFGPNSELSMPAYVYPQEIQQFPWIPRGTLVDTTFTSAALGNSRPVRVYTPPAYNPMGSATYPVALFHDGLEWINFALAPNTLDYLINERRIQPLIAVFVPPVDRGAEYTGAQKDQYSSFIVNDLMGYIDSRYRTKKDPVSRAVLGISAGSMISLWIGYHYPGSFGNAGAFSGVDGDDIAAYRDGPRVSLRLYVDIGTYERSIAGGYDLLNPVRRFHSIIDTAGYEHRYNEWHEGHSWGNWRAHLDNALEFFFPGSAVAVPESRELPARFALLQNYPNPFNPTTVVSAQWPEATTVDLSVFDLLGREVAALARGRFPAGKYDFRFDGRNLPAGIYIARLKAGRFTEYRKMLLLR